MATKVTLRSACDDGTNIFTEMEIIKDGNTFPIIRPVFPTGTPASAITAYMQVIANNQPVLAAGISAIVNSSVIA